MVGIKMAKHRQENIDYKIIGYEWVPAWMHDNPVYNYDRWHVDRIAERIEREQRSQNGC